MEPYPNIYGRTNQSSQTPRRLRMGRKGRRGRRPRRRTTLTPLSSSSSSTTTTTTARTTVSGDDFSGDYDDIILNSNTVLEPFPQLPLELGNIKNNRIPQ
ncbi:hypothetical protein M5D96_011007 [Drosophila gunungcola]|uniref:Uncharacterized protein n=2 Tax=Drosophila gunungcola TaxID=103775 RepID=A0A9P9YFS8_9MUSC|nr:hypothetical protein M5D96_011007 [Drosophila gunungcola]